MSTRNTLSFATEQELYDEVKALMDSNERVGGFNFSRDDEQPETTTSADTSDAAFDVRAKISADGDLGDFGSFNSISDAFESFKDELGAEWKKLGLEEQATVQRALTAIVHNTALAAAYPAKAANYQRNIILAKGTLAAVQSIAGDRMRMAVSRSVEQAFEKLLNLAFAAIFAV